MVFVDVLRFFSGSLFYFEDSLLQRARTAVMMWSDLKIWKAKRKISVWRVIAVGFRSDRFFLCSIGFGMTFIVRFGEENILDDDNMTQITGIGLLARTRRMSIILFASLNKKILVGKFGFFSNAVAKVKLRFFLMILDVDIFIQTFLPYSEFIIMDLGLRNRCGTCHN